MFGFDCMQITLSIFIFDRPTPRYLVTGAPSHFTTHLDLATLRLHLFSTRFPHHAWASPRIAKGIDERLNYFRSIPIVALRKERVLNRATERKSLDALRRPVGRDFFAGHAPDFFSITFEECVEETFAELIAYPLFEIARIPHREEARLHPRKNAKNRFENAEFQQRFERLQRIGKKFAAVKNTRGTRAHEHVIRQNLGPQVFDGFRFGKEPVSADVEVKTFVSGGARNAADVNRIGFQDNHVDFLLGQEVTGCQTRWSGTDNGDFCFHLFLRNPIPAGEIPDVPALYAQPGRADQRDCRDA